MLTKTMGNFFTEVKDTGLLQSEQLHQYILDTSVFPRESEHLKELRKATESHPMSFMGTSPLAGQLLSFMLKTVKPKKTIEVGVFTGYSLLATALSIPDDGKITAVDIDREAYNVGLALIKKAGVESKISFIVSDAMTLLDDLLADGRYQGSYDFAFVDADKTNYVNYHERLIELVKVGGIIAYDNTLWGGTVALPESEVPDFMKNNWVCVTKLNEILGSDARIDIAHLPVGDGITFCRRVY
uniref:Caffeoyl-CoA O-methyltransferase n=1 Tax=Stellaria longipes TaxID=19744 RepID=CAMT_STELP|nr:RecName: Full=Caffeoyl-CoA O-methyltransferase; AltName: Full=Trans-caffeoyl-CoA 3-O-methyltransferase; Short=CCoAMT; Short=CCoAOMT [Stellaria longipes]AAB61680.1 S-adenosyl-L-methionine:trans-caffeoyl-CoA 3-O-methyltransferase [Stellaria longipes]